MLIENRLKPIRIMLLVSRIPVDPKLLECFNWQSEKYVVCLWNLKPISTVKKKQKKENTLHSFSFPST